MRNLYLQLSATVALALTPLAPLWAWGDNGHIAVAKVADTYLTQTTKAQITQLLGKKTIYDRSICMFADTYKRTPPGAHTKPWHYVDIPADPAASYDAARDCKDDDCVVAQIEAQRKILKDKKNSKAQRAMALKFLIHFVGDIHQPLHSAERNGDQGGNQVLVKFLGGRGITNLHAVWDTDILDENLQGIDPEQYGTQIRAKITPSKKTEWQKVTDPVAWATEGHQAAVTAAYDGVPVPAPNGPPFNLDETYVNRAKPVVETQIEKAGARLAKLLTDTLK